MRWALLFAAALVGCGGAPFSVLEADPSDAGGVPDVIAPLEASSDGGFAELGDTGGGARDTGPTLPDTGPTLPDAGIDSSSSDPPDAGWAGDAWAWNDAGPYGFQPSPGAPLCDQDEDGFAAAGCTASNCAGGACKGIDCDDLDPRAYPGELEYLPAYPRPATLGDWNCNHVVEKQFVADVDCSIAGASCGSTSGFVGDPPCGAEADFVRCGTISGVCVELSRTLQVQACK